MVDLSLGFRVEGLGFGGIRRAALKSGADKSTKTFKRLLCRIEHNCHQSDVQSDSQKWHKALNLCKAKALENPRKKKKSLPA